QRIVGERALGGPAGPDQAVGSEAAHGFYPRRVDVLELGNGVSRSTRVIEIPPAGGRAPEVRGVPLGEDTYDHVREPPGNRGHRRNGGRGGKEFVGQTSLA